MLPMEATAASKVDLNITRQTTAPSGGILIWMGGGDGNGSGVGAETPGKVLDNATNKSDWSDQKRLV